MVSFLTQQQARHPSMDAAPVIIYAKAYALSDCSSLTFS